MSDAIVRTLRQRMAGEVVAPGDPGWDTARTGFNVRLDQRPAAVAYPASVDDAVALVRAAGEAGARVAPQGTGHGAGALGALDGAVLVRTERLAGVAIDPTARRASVRAGARWADVTPLADAHGLAALAGSSPTVRVAGYTLGGGIGWLCRRFGIACNRVRSVDLVTADGVARTVDHEREPDLFWALRGGGGSFGLVTGLEFDLVAVDAVHAGTLLWPFERAQEILGAWSNWVDAMPDTVTSNGRLLQLPPPPIVPEPFGGRSFVGVHAAILASQSDAEALLAPLRALAPEMDTFATMPPSGLGMLNMDPQEPVPFVGNGGLLTGFGPDAVAALAAAAGPGSGSPLVSLEVRRLGGAVATPPPGAGALAAIDEPIMWFGVAIAPHAEAAMHADGFLDRLGGALAPWTSARTYLNFAERKAPGDHLFGPEAHPRLCEVRRRHDPDGRFLANHVVEHAAA